MASKIIKVEAEVYDRLGTLKGDGQTFSDVIRDLLTLQGDVVELLGRAADHIKDRRLAAAEIDARNAPAPAVREI